MLKIPTTPIYEQCWEKLRKSVHEANSHLRLWTEAIEKASVKRRQIGNLQDSLPSRVIPDGRTNERCPHEGFPALNRPLSVPLLLSLSLSHPSVPSFPFS